MDIPDAVTVIKIMLTADGGCPHCCEKLMVEYVKKFPEHTDLVKELWSVKNPNRVLDLTDYYEDVV